MYDTLSALQFRSQFSQCLTHVGYTGKRLLIVRHGRDAAALVTVQDLDALEEAQHNSEAFMKARHDAKMREWQLLKDGLAKERGF
ncbi:MAG: type II toxin-antitoxin system Phd/YefM family antitoxin [Roseovarius sp.]